MQDQFAVWRPILAGMVSLADVECGRVTLERLLQLNGLLDMKGDIEVQAHAGT